MYEKEIEVSEFVASQPELKQDMANSALWMLERGLYEFLEIT